MPAFEALPGMPYWQDLVTDEPQKAAYFYSKLLGWEVGRDAYRVARKDGLPVAGIVPAQRPILDWVVYFLGDVEDRVVELGGKVVSAADVSLGRMVICEDPAEGLFGLIQPAGEDQFVAAGEPGVPVWYEYVTASQAAIDFYAELFDWEIERHGNYFLATREGAPFLGFLLDDDAEAPFWQTFFGVRDMGEAVSTVKMFNGEVIQGPVDAEFGRMLVGGDPTGTSFFLCEVDEPVFEEFSEADSILDLEL